MPTKSSKQEGPAKASKYAPKPVAGNTRGKCDHLSHACSAYCRSLCEPFKYQARIPMAPVAPTFLYTMRFKTSLVLNSSDANLFAGLSINPFTCLFNNNTNPVLSTGGSALINLGSAISGWTAVTVPTPFTEDQFKEAPAGIPAAGGGRFKLVSAGIRCRYKGPRYYCGGTVYANPGVGGQELYTGSPNQINGYNTTRWEDVKPGEWHYVAYTPFNDACTDLLSFTDIAGEDLNRHTMYLLMVNPSYSSTNTSVDFEVVCNFEVHMPAYIYVNASAKEGGVKSSISPLDPKGTQNVVAARQMAELDRAREDTSDHTDLTEPLAQVLEIATNSTISDPISAVRGVVRRFGGEKAARLAGLAEPFMSVALG